MSAVKQLNANAEQSKCSKLHESLHSHCLKSLPFVLLHTFHSFVQTCDALWELTHTRISLAPTSVPPN